jgi:hypothetical protein
MRFGNYSVEVVGGDEDFSGYVGMRHAATYSLRLYNDSNVRADAEVRIDGKEVGVFRVEPWSNIVLERPINDKGKFTFFRKSSKEAKDIGANSISKFDTGLVQVTFKPEKHKPVGSIWDMVGPTKTQPYWPHNPHEPRYEVMCSTGRHVSSGPCGQSVSAGITGLTGKSSQKFINVTELDYDPLGVTIISLRLIERATNDSPRPLVSYNRGNPVPSPV